MLERDEAPPSSGGSASCPARLLVVTLVCRTGFRVELELDEYLARFLVKDFKSLLAVGVFDGVPLLVPGLDGSQVVLRHRGQELPDSVKIGECTTTGELTLEVSVRLGDDIEDVSPTAISRGG